MSANSLPKASVVSVTALYRRIWERLSVRQKRWFAAVCAVAATNSVLEAAAVGATAVFGSALLLPGDFPGRGRLVQVTSAFGYPDLSQADLRLAAGALALVALVVRSGYSLVKTYLDARYTSWCFRTLSTEAFRAVLQRPYKWHVARNSATVVKAIQEDMWMVHQLIILAVGLSTDLLLLVVLLLVIAWKVGAVALAAFGALGAVGLGLHRLAHRRLRGLAESEHQANLGAALMATQALHGVKDVQVLGREEVLVKRFEGERIRMSHLRGRTESLRQLPRLVMEFLGFLGLMGILALGGGSDQAELTSTLAVLAVTFLRLLPAINRLLLNMAVVSGLIPGATHAMELLAEQVPRTPRTRGTEALELQHVTYAHGDEPALQDVSLVLKKGESLGLVGYSGAGKTTLADLVAGLLEPDQGVLKVGGRVGYVLQDPFLLDASMAQNVAFSYDDVDREKVRECLRMAQLEAFVETLPNGLDTQVGERGARLSGGQAQRLAIARSLYNDPDILILDEATSALDNLTEAAFMEMLLPLAQRFALIIIAHRLSTVQACGSILVLDKGRVVDRGAHAELMERCELYRTLVRSKSTASS